MNITASQLSSALRAELVKVKSDPGGENGICSRLSGAVLPEFMAALKRWPKYSGDPEYPIPHPSLTARAGYLSERDLWAGEYGQLRLEAIGWMLGEVTIAAEAPPKKIYSIPIL